MIIYSIIISTSLLLLLISFYNDSLKSIYLLRAVFIHLFSSTTIHPTLLYVYPIFHSNKAGVAVDLSLRSNTTTIRLMTRRNISCAELRPRATRYHDVITLLVRAAIFASGDRSRRYQTGHHPSSHQIYISKTVAWERPKVASCRKQSHVEDPRLRLLL